MGTRRLFAALAVVALCAPSTWLRTEILERPPTDVVFERVEASAETPNPAWRIEGLWSYTTGPNHFFGGFSALLALGENKLRAFSDRGVRFTFTEPDSPLETPEARVVARQLVSPEVAYSRWDIESATRDPVSGDYWLAYEYVHAIQRFSIASEIEKARELEDEVEWTSNSGAEAMVRLADGRFLVLAEGKREVLIYPGDPVEGGEPEAVGFVTPVDSYVVTDMAQLPDGRVLLLMRNLVWGYPPFGSLLAIGDPPQSGASEPWEPQVSLRFDDIIPNENYEGLAVRARPDGSSDVWVISDDNFSAMQRTLLVKLRFDPSASDEQAD